MTIMTRIYALIDPRSGKPFYIGRTSMRLRQRLDNHVRDGKRKTTPKSLYIAQILDAGVRPEIIELASTDSQERSEIEALEQAWIDFYGFTHKLKNSGSSVLGGSGNNAKLEMNESMVARLGKEPDGKLAEEWGCDRKTVEYHRTKRGLKRCPQLNFSPPPKSVGMALPDWAIALLGKQPDYKIAEQVGVSKATIARNRKEMEIPSFAETTGKDGQFGKHRKKARNAANLECPWCQEDGETIATGKSKYGSVYLCKVCEFSFSQATFKLIPNPRVKCPTCSSLKTMKNWRTLDSRKLFCRDCGRRFLAEA